MNYLRIKRDPSQFLNAIVARKKFLNMILRLFSLYKKVRFKRIINMRKEDHLRKKYSHKLEHIINLRLIIQVKRVLRSLGKSL